MSDPFLAQIQICAFNFAPFGWAFCNGQILPIAQNTALFSLLGTTYGGNGTSNFALPNLQSQIPIGFGQGPGLTQRDLGESGGEEAVTLVPANIPGHTHPANCSAAIGNSYDPAGNVWSVDAAGNNEYGSGTISGKMSALATTATGGDAPHNNIQPYLALNFCIALQGIFPARS